MTDARPVDLGGRRALALDGHAALILMSRPLWLAVLQSWRRAAWRDAMAGQAFTRFHGPVMATVTPSS